MTWGLQGESSSKKRKWKVHSVRMNRGGEGASVNPLARVLLIPLLLSQGGPYSEEELNAMTDEQLRQIAEGDTS